MRLYYFLYGCFCRVLRRVLQYGFLIYFNLGEKTMTIEEQERLDDEEREKFYKLMDEIEQDEFKGQCEQDEREREEQKYWDELEKKLSEDEIKTFFKRMYEMKFEEDEIGGTKKGDYVGNIVKYVTRFKYTHENYCYEKKNRIEYLKKARFCLDLLIDRELDK
jgi:hypothetical protein